LKYFIFVLFIIIIFVSPTYAVITFERWYGLNQFDCGVSVDQTSGEGYYIAGTTGAFSGPWDYYLIRTDSLGDTLWTKTYGGSEADFAYYGLCTFDGGYAIVGYTLAFGAEQADVYLVRVDSIGDTLWTYVFRDTSWDMGFSVDETSDKGYIITGSHNYSRSVLLIKLDSLGNDEWTRIYGGNDIYEGHSVIQTNDGGYLIGGYKMLSEEQGDVWLIKTNSVGDTLWTRTYGSIGRDVCYSVQQTSDGGYIAAASNYNSSGRYDVWLIKTDKTGDSLWSKVYGTYDYEYGKSVQQTSDNGYIIGGNRRENVKGYWDIYLIRTDSLGDTLWTKLFGGDNVDTCHCVKQTSDKGFVVTGETKSFGSGIGNVYLIKTDSMGNVAGVDEGQDQRHKAADLRLICHPNPFTTSTTIYFSSIEPIAEGIELTVYDISGRLVKSVPLTTNHLSLGTDLNPGIYFLKLSGKPAGKVVKMR